MEGLVKKAEEWVGEGGDRLSGKQTGLYPSIQMIEGERQQELSAV